MAWIYEANPEGFLTDENQMGVIVFTYFKIVNFINELNL